MTKQVEQPFTLSPADLKSARGKLKLSQSEISERLGVSKRTWIRYETGGRPVPTVVAYAVKYLVGD